MSTIPTVQARNQELARQINEEALSNPSSLYAGKFVGIANGQIVAVGDDAEAVVRRLRSVEPNPQNTFFVKASYDYSRVHDIWSVC